MQTGNTLETWGWVTRTLHWTLVLLVVAQLIVGFWFAALPEGNPTARVLFPIHTTIGITVFVTMAFRLVWRLSFPVPVLPDDLADWQKKMAHANHYFFYFLLLAMPVVGYLMVSAHGAAPIFFGLRLPPAIPPNRELADGFEALHAIGALLLLAAITLHVAGAVRHILVLKDGVVRRMTYGN